MQKRIVVLGGVGFIGTHLCLRLLEEGHEVFCVDIRDAVNSPLLRGVLQHPLFRYVHHNIINGFSIRCDEIYNLASPSRVRYNKALPVETLRVSVLGAINALDTARTEHACLLYTSDAADEDLVEGLVRLMEAPPSAGAVRTVNLGSNHEIAIRALAEKIVALTGSRSRIVHTAARADDARRRTPDISAARRELGWVPRTPLAEGLRRTISYAEKELADKAYAGVTWAEMN